MADWRRILDNHHIEYTEGGKSTAKGNIYVRCPLCGAADQSFHLGISVHSSGFRGWACWKNDSHRGKSQVKLLCMLLNISRNQALDLLGLEQQPLEEDQTLSDKLKSMLLPKAKKEVDGTPLKFPKEFHRFTSVTSKKPFVEYLTGRGYTREQVIKLAPMYLLHFALQGMYRYRIIFPVYTKVGLTTWTGRTIVPNKEPRYLTLSPDPETHTKQEGLLARANIKNCLFNERFLTNRPGKVLFVCEGPFDAMKIDFVGRPTGVNATCIFGKSASSTQLEKLRTIGSKFDRQFLVLDPDAEMDVFKMSEQFKTIGFETVRLRGKNDPGAMSLEEVRQFIQNAIR